MLNHQYTGAIVIPQRKIPARGWSKQITSRDVHKYAIVAS